MMDNYDDDLPSKSELKRIDQARKQLGIRLVGLNNNQLHRMNLNENLIEAVLLAQKIKKKSEGYRRQIQYVAKLLRQEEIEDIENRLEDLLKPSKKHIQLSHQIEQLKEQLLLEPQNTIQQLLLTYPQMQSDVQHIRQLIRKIQKTDSHDVTSYHKKLFFLLKTYIN